MSKFNWNEDYEAMLTKMVEGMDVVTQDDLESFAATLAEHSEKEVSKRQVGAKLRNMNLCEVEKAGSKARLWTDEDTASLEVFVKNNANALTYAEIATAFNSGQYTTRQVQGKILSLELTDLVNKTEKVAAPRTYTPEEEATFIEMASKGAFLEDIAEALGKKVNSVRGKALSLHKQVEGFIIPAQKNKAEGRADALADIEDIASLTVEQIAEQADKSVRGIKSMLSRRGITCQNYDGAARKAKLDEAKGE